MSTIKIYGNQTASKKQGSDKLFVTTLNPTELRKVFGSDGRYASQKALVFDGTTNMLYYLKQFNSNSDALVTENWLPTKTETASASEWQPITYNKGSLVSLTNGDGSVKFYFSTNETTPTEQPSVSGKWFEIPTGNTQSSQPRQLVYGSVNKTSVNGHSSRKINITVDSDVSLNGNRIPIIQVLIRTVGDKYEIAHPKVEFTKGSNITCYVEFLGSLEKLHNESNNVIITLI